MHTQGFPWFDDVGLIVANVPWDVLVKALQSVGADTFEVRQSVDNWDLWMGNWDIHEAGKYSVLAGELAGHAYVLDPGLCVAGASDRIVALAARTGGLVLGHAYWENVDSGNTSVAYGAHLRRYSVHSNWGDHDEGSPLPGETAESPAWESAGVRDIIGLMGFNVNAWLRRGRKFDVLWTMSDPDVHPEAHAAVYFGPLRQRVDWIHQAALEEYPDE